mgnify:CR=1 FL=1
MSEPRIGVIGLGGQSAFLKAHHFPAPGETISCKDLFFEPGGKGYNQAIACARMGVPTVFVGAVGKDDNGEICRKDLLHQGVIPCLVEKEIPTAYAVITTNAEGENTVSVFPGAAKALTPEDLRSEPVMTQLRQCSCLLLQNELTQTCLLEACRIGRELEIPVIFNPAPAENVPWEAMRSSTWITPNYGEAKRLAGFTPAEMPPPRQLEDRFARIGISRVVVTMGSNGAAVMEAGEICEIPAFSAGTAVDTTGAGDTFNGVLTAMLATGETVINAATVAAVAAGISVTRHGAAGSIPTKTEIDTACVQRERIQNEEK